MGRPIRPAAGNVSSLVAAMRMRRMRHLVGPRRHRGVVDAVELALVAERLAGPGPAEDVERLAEAGLALGVGTP